MGQKQTTTVPAGTWGGVGVEVVVKKDSVMFAFDCASGEIPIALMVDSRGNFRVAGTHRRSTPGALRPGLQPKPSAVRYEGKVTGKKIKFRAVSVESGESLGEFTAEFGKEARIRGCR